MGGRPTQGKYCCLHSMKLGMKLGISGARSVVVCFIVMNCVIDCVGTVMHERGCSAFLGSLVVLW